ncbi:MAG: hypothetical protein SPH38_05520, partial [Eubacteriales bacterium]|nr:hypothetical protein [Eubacteriales bacterium]
YAWARATGSNNNRKPTTSPSKKRPYLKGGRFSIYISTAQKIFYRIILLKKFWLSVSDGLKKKG